MPQSRWSFSEPHRNVGGSVVLVVCLKIYDLQSKASTLVPVRLALVAACRHKILFSRIKRLDEQGWKQVIYSGSYLFTNPINQLLVNLCSK